MAEDAVNHGYLQNALAGITASMSEAVGQIRDDIRAGFDEINQQQMATNNHLRELNSRTTKLETVSVRHDERITMLFSRRDQHCDKCYALQTKSNAETAAVIGPKVVRWRDVKVVVWTLGVIGAVISWVYGIWPLVQAVLRAFISAGSHP